MSEKKEGSLNTLLVTYVVSVVSVIVSLAMGAMTVAGGISIFTKESVDLPAVFAVFGGGKISLVAAAALALFAGVIACLGMKKIATSSEAGALVASDGYDLTNKAAKAFSYLMAIGAVVAALGILLGALLSINDYTPWKSYFLGEVLPLVFLAIGLAVAGVLIDKFSKAQIKPNMLPIVALIVAGLGMILVMVAVIVSTHTSGSSDSTYNTSTYRTLRIDY